MSEDDEAIDTPVTEKTLRERLDSLRETLDDAETEADLDAVEDDLDAVISDVESADLPVPEDDDEQGPTEELETAVGDLRDDLESKRGPYAGDVVDRVESVVDTVEDTRWTDDGVGTVRVVVEDFLDAVGEVLEGEYERTGDDPDALAETLSTVGVAVGAAGLDPDDDAAAIAALLDATDELDAGVDDAEEWEDLTTREQLDAQGFYDVLEHRKDFPPEWNAVKIYEQQNDPEMILLALDALESDFMEENCMESLKKLGPEAALDAMTTRAKRRDKPAIEVLGKIGSEEPVEMLLEYAATESDPQLQVVTLRALGEIGSEEATQTVANQLALENETVRSQAARALGLIGDTRAIGPLEAVLADDGSDSVRASAAWALRQIGTERALRTLGEYTDDRSYIVQVEAEKAV